MARDLGRQLLVTRRDPSVTAESSYPTSSLRVLKMAHRYSSIIPYLEGPWASLASCFPQGATLHLAVSRVSPSCEIAHRKGSDQRTWDCHHQCDSIFVCVVRIPMCLGRLHFDRRAFLLPVSSCTIASCSANSALKLWCRSMSRYKAWRLAGSLVWRRVDVMTM